MIASEKGRVRSMSWRVFQLTAAIIIAASAVSGDETVSLREWQDLTSGKTVYYSRGGTVLGKEYYERDAFFLVYEGSDGQCVEGVWAYTDDRFCFLYGPNFQCYNHVRRDGKLYSQSDTGQEELEINRIVDEPLACPPG